MIASRYNAKANNFANSFKHYQKLAYLNASYLVNDYLDAVNIANSIVVKLRIYQKKIPVVNEWLEQAVADKATKMFAWQDDFIIDTIPYKTENLTVLRTRIKQILDDNDFINYTKLVSNNWDCAKAKVSNLNAKFILKHIHSVLLPTQGMSALGALNNQQIIEIVRFIKKVVLDLNEEFADDSLISKFIADIHVDFIEKNYFRLVLKLKNCEMSSTMAFKIKFDFDDRLVLEHVY